MAKKYSRNIWNIMIEQWSQWRPIQGLSLEYYVESIIDGCDGLKIFLGDNIDDNRPFLKL